MPLHGRAVVSHKQTHALHQMALLFDDLIRAGMKHWGHFNAQCLCGF
jgi:hypothetical protein